MIPLPEPYVIGRAGIIDTPGTPLYTADQMRDYGSSCADEALEQAAEVVNDMIDTVSSRIIVRGLAAAVENIRALQTDSNSPRNDATPSSTT